MSQLKKFLKPCTEVVVENLNYDITITTLNLPRFRLAFKEYYDHIERKLTELQQTFFHYW